jgi:four helix bundle protein
MRSNFENLLVYQLSKQIADQIWSMVMEWNSFVKNSMGLQLVRAADSVGANIVEGQGRGSYADDRRFVRIPRGSLNEIKHFLRRDYRRGLLKTADVEALGSLMDELGPQLNSYLKSIGTTRPIATPNQQPLATVN